MLIPKITDVYVSIDVTHPQFSKDFKKIAIFTKSDKQSFKSYTYLPDLMADFGQNTSTYKTAAAIFAQDDAPEVVQVITYTDQVPAPDTQTASGNGGLKVTDINANTSDQPAAGIGRAAFDYFYEDWEIAILADYNQKDALALADVIEHGGYDGKGFHFMLLQFNGDNAGEASAFDKYNRTFYLYHTNTDERADAALASEATYATVGKQSWKFTHDLNGITPETLTVTQILNLERQHFIVYVQKGDHASFTDDKNAQGLYIDFIHGMDFVKATVENNLQNSLTLNGKGVFTFDARGLNAVKESITNTLNTAGDNGIIRSDDTGKYEFDVQMPDISKFHESTIEHRILEHVKFNYTASSAINEIHINGNVVA
ncbi:hypothetical protein M2S00_06680 [Apilactobacillus sp. TMW 2.2459]|uniref:hypothetical protein n=1 Tax=Apilactobacillus xinyiensis TaxID=2841032 RepID=UPI00200BE95D|nr:hypothetical protein [Apilactobacillus xinyiensis]MCL0312789.1 hypothetical protein [Apilactobacillus xinyiensis]